MAVDAFVYCDCLETNNLRCDPPSGLKVHTASNGDLVCDAPGEAEWSAFMDWKQHRACLHFGMILLRHRLGTAEQVDLLRSQLATSPEKFPILLKHVLYSGTHTCDWIPSEKVPLLSEEVRQLAPEKAPAAVADALQLLKIRMAELIIAAQHTKKAICF